MRTQKSHHYSGGPGWSLKVLGAGARGGPKEAGKVKNKEFITLKPSNAAGLAPSHLTVSSTGARVGEGIT